tara:strand:+ start:101 stop:976 length:876 start_codon:yes stop_codon:yes gene_type:complete
MVYLNEFKYRYLEQLCSVNSLKNSWPVWESKIKYLINEKQWGQSVFCIGDNLSDVFLSTKDKGRSQSGVSGGGAAWECLVTWYLNLLFLNTNVIAVRQNKDFVPKCISDCLTVTISNTQTNTESDILVYSVPDHLEITGSKISDLDSHLSTRINKVDLVVLQCKTNWEDNAQIPMLWDMIYNSESRLTNVSVGVNGLNPQSLGKFKYGFVTVPTGKRGNQVKPGLLKVLRVKNLTGGNYWGKPSTKDVASSIKEFGGRHFPNAFPSGIPNHLVQLRAEERVLTEKFLELNF